MPKKKGVDLNPKQLHICPDCGTRGMIEWIDADGSVHHEHSACTYLMIWKPRRTKWEILSQQSNS